MTVDEPGIQRWRAMTSALHTFGSRAPAFSLTCDRATWSAGITPVPLHFPQTTNSSSGGVDLISRSNGNGILPSPKQKSQSTSSGPGITGVSVQPLRRAYRTPGRRPTTRQLRLIVWSGAHRRTNTAGKLSRLCPVRDHVSHGIARRQQTIDATVRFKPADIAIGAFEGKLRHALIAYHAASPTTIVRPRGPSRRALEIADQHPMVQVTFNPDLCRRASPRPFGVTFRHIIESLLDTLLVGRASFPWFNDQTGRNGSVLTLQGTPAIGVAVSKGFRVAHRISLIDLRRTRIASHKPDVRKSTQSDGHLRDDQGGMGSRAPAFSLTCDRSLNRLPDTFFISASALRRRASLARRYAGRAPHHRAPPSYVAFPKQPSVVQPSSPQLDQDDCSTSHLASHFGKPEPAARHPDAVQARSHVDITGRWTQCLPCEGETAPPPRPLGPWYPLTRRLGMHRRTLQRILAKRAPR
jgi:hypothetical protein